MRSIARLRAVVVIQAPGLRGTPVRPHLERDDEGVLDRFLGQVEVAQHADESRDRAPRLLTEHAVDSVRRRAYCRTSASLEWTWEPAAS